MPTQTPDGSFVFKKDPPGDYVVQAMRPRQGNRGSFEFGVQFVTVVDGDPKPVSITTSPGATLNGRMVHEGPNNQSRADVSRFAQAVSI